MTKTRFDMNFNDLANYGHYYGYVPNGYKGFDFSVLYYYPKHGLPLVDQQEHTGYGNDEVGNIIAFSPAEDNVSNGYGWAAFYSPTKETFTLLSGDFASAWDSKQTIKFTTYRGDKVVAADYITVHHAEQTIDFAGYGNDFKNITKLRFETNYKYAFNLSGKYGKGWQVVVDNIKGRWNGPEPGARDTQRHPHIAQPLFGPASHGIVLALAANNHHTNFDFDASHGAYHSVITSLDGSLGHHDGGLTAEFSLPGSEHFGT